MIALGFSAGLAALTGLLAADPAGMYLPPSDTGGSEFQFNPASVELRQTVKTEWHRDDLLDGSAGHAGGRVSCARAHDQAGGGTDPAAEDVAPVAGHVSQRQSSTGPLG